MFPTCLYTCVHEPREGLNKVMRKFRGRAHTLNTFLVPNNNARWEGEKRRVLYYT